MSKADVIEIEGTVVEKLPNTMFQVELQNHCFTVFSRPHSALTYLHTISQRAESSGEISKG